MQGPAGVRTVEDGSDTLSDIEPGAMERPEGIVGPAGAACRLVFALCHLIITKTGGQNVSTAERGAANTFSFCDRSCDDQRLRCDSTANIITFIKA